MVDPTIFNDVDLFALLDEEERRVLAQQVDIVEFEAGQTIFKVGEAGIHAYIVQRGRVSVSLKTIDNEEIVIDIADRGDIFGMSSLLAQAEHMTTAVALESTQTIEIDLNDILVLVQQKPQAGLDMMTTLEKQLRSTQELMRNRVVRNPNVEIEQAETFGERMADAVARFGGSWTFVIAFAVILVIYTSINTMLHKPWDPDPFILLNLFLSMLAAIQAPVIMMSQNRQDAKDRVRSELDFRVNQKAELEIGEVLQRVSRIEQKLGEMKHREVQQHVA
jgi:CRP/FNR family cyclic AMP-dependent transcriptional regulator